MSIKRIIQAAKEIRTTYIGGGKFEDFSYKCYKPAANEEIDELANVLNIIIPDDYREFLSLTNGMLFFHSGDFRLFSVSEILELRNPSMKEGIYCIGEILEYNILIKSDEVVSGKYIYVGDSYSLDEYYPLHMNFEKFLDHFFMAGGNNYWTWHIPEKVYDFSEY